MADAGTIWDNADGTVWAATLREAITEAILNPAGCRAMTGRLRFGRGRSEKGRRSGNEGDHEPLGCVADGQ